jgi:copper chaperone NosL
MELEAPQYPNGLFLTAYVNHLTGDVREIDGLNHYIGMRPLGEAAAFERAASVWMIIAMFLLVEGAAFIHSKWAVLLAIPAITFPPGSSPICTTGCGRSG